MVYIRGIDVSSYDPYIDWQKVRSQNIQFVIIKSTEGTHYLNEHFDAQWAGAKSVGILRGSYHYLRAKVDGAKQADYFLSKVKVEDGDLPPFLDIEGIYNDGVIDGTAPATNSQYIGNTQKWLERVEAKTGRRPIVYSTAAFLKNKLSANGKPPPWAKKYATWVAQYPYSFSADGGFKPTQPVGWGEWVFWQYSGDHDTLEGIYEDDSRRKLILVDLNVYRHPIEELFKLAKAKYPPDDKPIDPNPEPEPRPLPQTHRVQAGDTFQAIADKYGVSLPELLNANPSLPQPGTDLIIPGHQPNPEPKPNNKPTIKYEVKEGDALSRLADKFFTTQEAIMALNPQIKEPNRWLIKGDTLTIPDGWS
jgi:GH25 family lysozyme M1 (1,4-beta-N-acetylmuramidase)/LysM repeat protein